MHTIHTLYSSSTCKHNSRPEGPRRPCDTCHTTVLHTTVNHAYYTYIHCTVVVHVSTTADLRVLAGHATHVLRVKLHRVIAQLGLRSSLQVLASHRKIAVSLHPPTGGGRRGEGGGGKKTSRVSYKLPPKDRPPPPPPPHTHTP